MFDTARSPIPNEPALVPREEPWIAMLPESHNGAPTCRNTRTDDRTFLIVSGFTSKPL